MMSKGSKLAEEFKDIEVVDIDKEPEPACRGRRCKKEEEDSMEEAEEKPKPCKGKKCEEASVDSAEVDETDEDTVEDEDTMEEKEKSHPSPCCCGCIEVPCKCTCESPLFPFFTQYGAFELLELKGKMKRFQKKLAKKKKRFGYRGKRKVRNGDPTRNLNQYYTDLRETGNERGLENEAVDAFDAANVLICCCSCTSFPCDCTCDPLALKTVQIPAPTPEPTTAPTDRPTLQPTIAPTDEPTLSPTNVPTTSPTSEPATPAPSPEGTIGSSSTGDAPTNEPSTESPTLEGTPVPVVTVAGLDTPAPSTESTPSPSVGGTMFPSDAPNSDTQGPTGESTYMKSDMDIKSFIMVDVANNATIAAIEDCRGCLTEDTNVTIQVKTVGAVGSVNIQIDGEITHAQVQNTAPYTLFGEANGVMVGRNLPVGAYLVKAQAHSEIDAQGESGAESTAFFYVVA